MNIFVRNKNLSSRLQWYGLLPDTVLVLSWFSELREHETVLLVSPGPPNASRSVLKEIKISFIFILRKS